MESREYTRREAQELFISHIHNLVNHWDEVKCNTSKEKLDGLAFSIMSAIDGSASNLPPYILSPSPHPSDKDFRVDSDEHYYPEGLNIAGDLHNML